MHRGGTSALAGTLVQLGIAAPRTLIPPDPANELGYWESAPITDFHSRLLHLHGTSWDAWSPVGRLEPGPHRDSLVTELQALMAEEYGSSERFVVKDPRMCRLVPFWQDTLAAADILPACVIIVRSPVEVACSLAARDGLPASYSALLWLRHMLDAEAGTRAIPRSVVRYADLLADWPSVLCRIAKDLNLSWPAGTPMPGHPVARYLRPELRHHVAAETLGVALPSRVSEWTMAAAEAFDRLAAGEMFDHEAILDEIRRQLDDAAVSFGMPAEQLRASEHRAFAQVETERRDVEAHERRAFENRLTALSEDVQALQREVETYQGLSATAEQRAAALEEDRDQLRHDVVRLEAQRERLMEQQEQLTRQLEAASHESDRRGDRVRDLQAAQQHLESRARELDAELAATRHHLTAVLSSRSWQITAPARAGLTALQRLLGAKASETGR